MGRRARVPSGIALSQRRRRSTSFGAIALLLLAPASVASQRRAPGPATVLVVGASHYDLTTSGTGFSGFAALTFHPARRLLLEPTLGYLTFRNDFGQRTHWFFPELSVQAEARLGRMLPFVGVGGGAGVASRVGSDRWEGALHAVTGLRVRLGRAWGGRAEVRLRAVPPWSGHTLDFGIGVIGGFF